jgi:hypothetical protein
MDDVETHRAGLNVLRSELDVKMAVGKGLLVMISFAFVLCQLMNGTRSDDNTCCVLVVHREQGTRDK